MTKTDSLTLPVAGNNHRIVVKKQPTNQVFVARHTALYQYCLEKGIISQDIPAYFKRVAIRDIKGKDVVGVLSLEMASFANTYTEIPLHGCHVEPGLELDIEDIRMGAGEPRTYQINKVVK